MCTVHCCPLHSLSPPPSPSAQRCQATDSKLHSKKSGKCDPKIAGLRAAMEDLTTKWRRQLRNGTFSTGRTLQCDFQLSSVLTRKAPVAPNRFTPPKVPEEAVLFLKSLHSCGSSQRHSVLSFPSLPSSKRCLEPGPAVSPHPWVCPTPLQI